MNNCINVIWNAPDAIPEVQKGSEKQFWIATLSKCTGKQHVYLAQYQNRPLEYDEHGELLSDDYLVSPDGEPHESVGWVSSKQHAEFDEYYELISFNDDYQLLGWAEYQPPTFDKCQHAWEARWDHNECKCCHAVKLGASKNDLADFGIAAGKTFSSMEEAKFYQKHGRLPE